MLIHIDSWDVNKLCGSTLNDSSDVNEGFIPIIQMLRKSRFSSRSRLSAIGTRVAGLVVLCGSLNVALSQETSVKDDDVAGPVFDMSGMVVTASRTTMDIVNVPQNVSVLVPADVEMIQASFGTDLMKKSSSVDVIQYPGGSSGVSIRGFRPEYSHETNPRVLLLIDGRPVSTSLGSIPTSNIERIEVLKGPASAIYGPSAMGGVINVITKKTTGDMRGSAFVDYGSFDTKQAGIAFGGNLSEQWDFDFSMDWMDRGDDYKFGDGDAYEVGRNGSGEYDNTTFERINGMVRLGYAIDEAWKLNFSYDISYQNDTLVPGPLSKQKFDADNPAVRDQTRQGGSIDLVGDLENHKVSAKLFKNRLDSLQTYSEDSYSSSYRGRTNDKQIDELGAHLQDVWSITENNDLVYGIDYLDQEENIVSLNGDGSARSYSVPNYDRERYGIYAESLNRFADDTVVFNLGGRWDHIKTTVEASTYDESTYQYEGGSEAFNHFSPRAGGVWKFAPKWRLHSSVGTAFIAPDSREVAGYYESEYSSYIKVCHGSDNLDPETSVSWDVGIGFEDKDKSFDVTLFRTDVDDRIVNVNTGKTEPAGEDGKTRRIYTYVNADSQVMQGLEFTARYELKSLSELISGKWCVKADLTYIDKAEVEVSNGDYEPVKNIADWKGNFTLEYNGGAYTSRFNARYNGERWDKDYTYDDYYGGSWYEFPDFWVFDWSLSYKIDAAQKLIFRVDNILDRYYYEKLDYPQEGRVFSVRYIYDF